jgi:two-component system, OmpR family, heavy metal sensor histidine kinase CusS
LLKGIKKITFNSIRFKVSLFYMAVLGVILIFYTGILYFGQRYALYRDLDRELAIKAQEIGNAINSFLPVLEDDQRAFYFVANMVIRQQGTYPQQENIAEAKKRWLEIRERLNLRNDYILLAEPDGKVIASSQNLDEQLLSRLVKGVATMPKAVLYRNINFINQRLRLITIPYYYKNKRPYLIQIGSSVSAINTILYGRTLFAALIIPLVLIFASFLGGVITQRILGPVMEVTSIARNITHKDLSARVKVERVDEELRYLVDAFNEMISRLDKSFRYIAEFSSNVAHELRTPLTIIRGESELALMQERDRREYQRVLKITQEETDGMLRIVEDLLLLSRLEYQPQVLNFEQLDFSSFIEEIFAQAKKMAGQKNIFVKLTSFVDHAFIYADGLHLKRMFLNLLNNAVKFTPLGGKIGINVRTEGKKLKVAIQDTGLGIKPEDIDKIFDRFFHADNVNQGGDSGSGLGLSIAQTIVKIHGGDISVKSQPQKGSTFIVTLPVIDKNLKS